MMSMMRNRTDSNDTGKRRDVSLRPARREEAPDIARLFLISSDGLAAYIWGGDSKVTRPLEDIGAARYAREGDDIRIDAVFLMPGRLPRHLANIWHG